MTREAPPTYIVSEVEVTAATSPDGVRYLGLVVTDKTGAWSFMLAVPLEIAAAMGAAINKTVEEEKAKVMH